MQQMQYLCFLFRIKENRILKNANGCLKEENNSVCLNVKEQFLIL